MVSDVVSIISNHEQKHTHIFQLNLYFVFRLPDDDHKWRHSKETKPIRRAEHNDPAILSYGGFSQRFVASQETVASSQDATLSKDRSNSPNLSTSEPDVRSILRYSRESLLILRDSELSKRKPEQLGRAWIRIGISSEGMHSGFFSTKKKRIFFLKKQ